MSLQKETFPQEFSKASPYKKSYEESAGAAYQDTCEAASQVASQAAYQAAQDYFARSMWNSISKIPTFWRNRNFIAQYNCCMGLTFGFQSNQNKCYIEISLAHLTKEEIVILLKKGKLHDELLTLYELAHLPFAEYGLMNIVGLDFDVIDYVKIRLDIAMNPKDHRQYGENWEFMLSRSQKRRDLNHNAADILVGLQSLRRE
jgi:hypothetical protein